MSIPPVASATQGALAATSELPDAIQIRLFKTFLNWLWVVGAVVVGAATAISVLTASYLTEVSRKWAEGAADKRITQLAGRMTRTEEKSDELLQKLYSNQILSQISASRASANLRALEDALAAANNSKIFLESGATISGAVANDPAFARAVSKLLTLEARKGARSEAARHGTGNQFLVKGGCDPGWIVMSYYCQVDADGGAIQNYGTPTPTEFTCLWNVANASAFKGHGVAICLRLKSGE